MISDKEFTTRCTINSSSLVAGDEDTLQYIQGEIANAYNDHMEEANLDYKLQLHHVSQIIIGTSQRSINGKVHVLIDFLDPCDQVTSLLWYQDQDPFASHDISQDIPNPRTRYKAKTNAEYAKLTLKEHGLWTVKAWLV